MNFSLATISATLERTPATLRAMLVGLPEELLRLRSEGEETWSPFDIVGHLVIGEKTDWIPRARIILAAEGDRRFTPFDRFAQEQESGGKSCDDLLDEFARLRAQNLQALAAMTITDKELTLTGTHPDFGSVTLQQLLATWSVHDLGHIARVLARSRRKLVGPWTKYLSILGR